MKRTYRKPQMKAITFETQRFIASSDTSKNIRMSFGNDEVEEMGVSGRRARY